MRSSPYYFDEFFASNREESVSPFLTPSSRLWSKGLSLKGAAFSAFLLLSAFGLSFLYPDAGALLLIGVYFLSGTPALISSIEDLKNFEINIDVLMTVAALLSVLIGSEFEGALLLVLFEFSGAMEASVTQKTKSALSSLHDLSPRFAYVLDSEGRLLARSVKEIPVGTTLLIKAGEIVPLDSVIIDGSSFVNLVHLTGESQPIAKRAGDEIQAGAKNLEGSLTLKVTRANADSTLTRIIELITAAQEAKPRLERLLDRFGNRYATTIMLMASAFALFLPYLFSMPYLGIEGSIYRALTFLIAASPCALILATPTVYLSAVSSCARKGILLKGGSLFDALSSCKIIAFDKTGTLTTGKLQCLSVTPFSLNGPSLDEAVAIAAGLERHAVHPIAEAILAYAEKSDIRFSEIRNFRSIPGYGLQGNVTLNEQEVPVFIGHADFIATQTGAAFERKKGITTYLLIGDTPFVFHFSDALRPQIVETVTELNKSFQTAMLTGDQLDNAQAVARQIPLNSLFADLRPEDKLKKVEELSQKEGLIMVGDGINDAPALARATVGISLGKIGSATAVDASDIVFLHDDLTLLPWLIAKSHKTLAILKQNLIIALIVILFATTPALLGWVPLWLAVILHEGGTVIVGLNSLRLLRS